MKYLITLLLFVGIFHVTQASAQCAAGIPSAGNPECLPPDDVNSPYYQGDGSQQPVQPQQPQAVWATRWGAVALDSATGAEGHTVGQISKSEAERKVLATCAEHGGENCRVLVSYYNQCAAVAQVQGGGKTTSARAPTSKKAEQMALANCGQATCKIVYSACSPPVRVQ